MREVPVAADVVLAPLLAGPVAVARVVVATPLAAYAELPADREPRLLALVAPAAVRVPGSLVTPPDVVGALRPGAQVRVGGGAAATAATATTRLPVARWWDSTVRPFHPCLPATAAGAAVPDAVSRGASRLAAALAGDGDVAAAVTDLVGLGPGLTPAGDDVLAALLVTLVAGGDAATAGAVLDGVRACGRRTTPVSAALLEHAGAGRAVPQLARHLRRPGDGQALAALLAVGGTSGAALALGARIGLSALSAGGPATMASPVESDRDGNGCREVA